MQKAVKVSVTGRVQGVGFRPFIFQLARQCQVKGTVENNMDGVKIIVEGNGTSLQRFLEEMEAKAPRLSKISGISTEPARTAGFQDFQILPSSREGTSMLVLPVDSSVCSDCIEEMETPGDRRYHYPFINCTQCGPRYTIISDLPYDRLFTAMNPFTMCTKCQEEYENPADRRHHAQPIACPECGPSIELICSSGERENEDPLVKTRQLLENGAIIAVKGIGGYHLCCDAENVDAVNLLRKRKRRPSRPLAVMARNLQAVEQIAHINEQEKQLLKSPEAPIVILRKKERTNLSANIAPGMETIGVMLPNAPLHHLIFKDTHLSCIIMTSANPSGLPILYKNEQAVSYLKRIADYILLHDRKILHPIDDSVVEIKGGRLDFLRRARGYVPEPISLQSNVNGIIAFGGQQKSVFTIGRNKQAFVGPHIGDLLNMETYSHYKNELDHLLSWIKIPYHTAAIDLHPDFTSREIAKMYPFSQIIEIQHHHAHMVSCMADNELEGDVWGIILDGTGYGEDGHIWGFEILYGNESEFTRKAHLQYTPLPGSEKAIQEPWRNAAAMLIALLGKEGEMLAHQLFRKKEFELNIIKTMIEHKINSPLAGSCGRLFDAVSAMTCVCEYSSYEGEAAVKLSELARDIKFHVPHYPFRIIDRDRLLKFDFSLMLKSIAADYLRGLEAGAIIHRFHETVVEALVSGVKQMSNSNLSRRVVLSGGSFHNPYLARRIKEELGSSGFEVYTHKNIPCNDGGLSFGQLVAAAAIRGNEPCV